MIRDARDLTDAPHVLVIRDPGRLGQLVRLRYPGVEVVSKASCLSGIAAFGSGPAVRHVLVGVDPSFGRLRSAVEALRKVLGPAGRLVLCCEPYAEPAARAALDAGADDYVIYPPRGAELDEALQLPRPGRWQIVPSPEPVVEGPSTVAALAGVLAELDQGQQHVLDRMAAILRGALRTVSLRIATESLRAEVGAVDAAPVLAESIDVGGRRLGQIVVGPREPACSVPYGAADVERLRHYATLVGHLLDACEKRRSLERLALTDELTALPNRRHVLSVLDATLQQAAATRKNVTLLLFDIDDFKLYNDRYGHGAGDEILREAGQLFRRCCRQHDVVARYGGDEFAVMFWEPGEPRVAGSKPPTEAMAVLRRFREALEVHSFPSLGPDARGVLTISGGLASFPWDAQRTSELIAAADRALLRAKRDGKNRIYLVGGESPEPGGSEDAAPRPFSNDAADAPNVDVPSRGQQGANSADPGSSHLFLRVDRVAEPGRVEPACGQDLEWCIELLHSPGVWWRAIEHPLVQRTAWYQQHKKDDPTAIHAVVHVAPAPNGQGIDLTADAQLADEADDLLHGMAEALVDYSLECQLDGHSAGLAPPHLANRPSKTRIRIMVD